MTRQGNLIVVSAPSGAGKTTLCRELIDIFPDLRHSVSYTTRPARAGEVDGEDYHFVSPERFAQMVEAGEFAEWAEVHGNRYGTALATLESLCSQGLDVLLEIDCQGAAQVRMSYSSGVSIFILPPSLKELRRRLQSRGTDSSEVIERRMCNAVGEIRQAPCYDYVVVNDDFSVALGQLTAIVRAEGCRRDKVLPLLAGVFEFAEP